MSLHTMTYYHCYLQEHLKYSFTWAKYILAQVTVFINCLNPLPSTAFKGLYKSIRQMHLLLRAFCYL